MIKSIDLYDVRLPLVSPYGNSKGVLEKFSSTIAVLKDESGNFGIGEATPAQPECQKEMPEDVWQFVTAQAKNLVGLEFHEAYEKLIAERSRHPFACASLLVGIEELQKEIPLGLEEIRMPLVGIINPKEGESFEEHVARRLEERYQTLKIKVGFEIDEDIAKAKKLQKLVGDRAWIRFDANQAYHYEDAVRFVTEVDPFQVQLLEQPFPSGEWDKMRELKKISRIPLMLDESIYDEKDVLKAGLTGSADFIKFKLMKSSSAKYMSKEIELARSYGITALIGNGVETDIGCYQESVIGYYNGVKEAGEQNGFLKPVENFFAQKLGFEQGNIVIPKGFTRELDLEKVKYFSIAERHFAKD